MREETLKLVLWGTGTALALVFCLGPLIYMLLTALTQNPDYLLPDKPYVPSLSGFKLVLFNESLHFKRYLLNSVVISALSSVGTVALAAPAAYAVSRLRLPGKTYILFGVLGITMFPPVSLVSYLFNMMSALHWINTCMALILPYVAWNMPLTLWILVSYFSQVPPELDESARMDGASRLQILFKIIMPVAAPGVYATGLLAFIFAFNEFLFALMLTIDKQARTIPVGIALFEGLHGRIPWGQIMAAATLASLPVVALTLIFQRRIVQGLTRGAVKG